jgi:PAS domain S-box-containing protein
MNQTLLKKENNVREYQPESRWEFYASALMENASDAIFLLALDGKILSANRQAEKLLGFPREQIEGKIYHEFVVTTDHEEAVAKVGKVMDGNQATHDEVQLRRADGEVVYVDFSAVLIDLGDEKVMMGIGRDITEQKKAGEDRDRLAAIVENSNDAIYAMDLDGKIRFWNRSAEKLFGYSSHEMLEHHVFTTVPSHLHFEILRMLETCQKGQAIQHFETVRKNRRKELFPVSVNWSPLFDSRGKVIGISAIIRDLTDLKRVEKAVPETENQSDKNRLSFLESPAVQKALAARYDAGILASTP